MSQEADEDAIEVLALRLYLTYYPASEASWRAAPSAERERWATVALASVHEWQTLTSQPRPHNQWPPITMRLRRLVGERDADRCVDCGNFEDLRMLRVREVAQGQKDTPENFVTVCCGDMYRRLRASRVSS